MLGKNKRLSYNKAPILCKIAPRIMKKIPLFLLLLASSVHAHTLLEYPSGRAVTLETGNTAVQVVNVWASWCVPCRREMPVLDRWQRQQARRLNVQLIGVGLDRPDIMRQFLQHNAVSYPIWRYAGQDSTAWMKTLGNPVGALPFTVVRRHGCEKRQTFFGEVSVAQLNRAVAQVQQQCGVK